MALRYKRRIIHVRQAMDLLAEVSGIQCRTCDNVSVEPSPYCHACDMYWRDVDNGLFDEHWKEGWV